MKANIVKEQARDVGMILIGNAAMGFGYAKLMVPNQIINGGVTSLSQIVNHFWPISIPMANNLWLALLLLLTLLFLGREIFFKSVLSSVVYSASFTVFFTWPLKMTTTPLLDLLIASVFIAFGYYACISARASTVGVDVFALIIQKFRPTVNLSRVISYFNYSILVVGFLAFGFWSVAYGLIFAFLYSHEMDWMFRHFGYGRVASK